jgi:hypothetical protein
MTHHRSRFRIPHVLLLVLGATLPIAHAGEAGVPPFDPLPRVQPLVLVTVDPATLSPADRLQRRLEALVRERDSRIRDLLETRADLRPATTVVHGASLGQPLLERDQARDELRRALESYDERTVDRRRDVLDTARPVAQAMQRSTLAATNQLRVAECYHDLAATGKPTAEDLAAGLGALELVEVAELGDGEPVRLHYLRAWFLIEQARQASGEDRAKLVASATDAVERLAQDHPDSDLLGAARSLLAGLALPGAEPSAPGRVAP